MDSKTQNIHQQEMFDSQNAWFQIIFAYAPIGIITLNQEGYICASNRSFQEMIRYRTDELSQMVWFSLFHPEDEPEAHRYFDLVSGKQHVFAMEKKRFVRKDGTCLWCQVTVSRMNMADEQSVVACALFKDISEKEEELRLSDERFFKIFHTSPVAISISTMTEGIFLDVNDFFLHLTGLTREEVLGHSSEELHFWFDKEDRATVIRTLNENALVRDMETRICTKNGRVLDVSLSAVIIHLDGCPQLLTLFHDITQRKKVERTLQHAREVAEAATRSRSNFLANMSHEIRTPLNAIIGMSEMLLQSNLSEELSDYVETIHMSGESLLAIVNDILDFSKIDAGKLNIEQKPFNLRRCIEQSLDIVSAKAVEKRICLVYWIDEHVPEMVVGDKQRLQQILVNLLGNGVKFTEQGEVSIHVESSQSLVRGVFKHMVHLTIQDTGIGIPAERMNMLFQSFSQVDMSTTRKYGGTGLGLAISKRIAEMMEGTIWVESEVGKGSTFSVVIHAEPAEDLESAHETISSPCYSVNEHLFGKRALIVCDNHTCQTIFSKHISRWGMTPTLVAYPAETLQMLQQEPLFDVVIVSVYHIDERALVKEIAQYHVPLILYTTLGERKNVLQFVGHIVSDVLIKPMKPLLLLQALIALFQMQRSTDIEQVRTTLPSHLVQKYSNPLSTNQLHTTLSTNELLQATSPSTVQDPPSQALHILVVEDNPFNQKVAIYLLQRIGYQADVVSSGMEALHIIQQKSYDIVFMDIQMPDMDGVATMQKIRSIIPLAQQPFIIAMTAYTMQGDRERWLSLGMDDYLSKPVRMDELNEKIEQAKATLANRQQLAGTLDLDKGIWNK